GGADPAVDRRRRQRRGIRCGAGRGDAAPGGGRVEGAGTGDRAVAGGRAVPGAGRGEGRRGGRGGGRLSARGPARARQLCSSVALLLCCSVARGFSSRLGGNPGGPGGVPEVTGGPWAGRTGIGRPSGGPDAQVVEGRVPTTDVGARG